MQIIDSNMSVCIIQFFGYLANDFTNLSLFLKPDKTDLDVVVDTTLLLWRKCKEAFQKHQTGAQDNYRWVSKLENMPKVSLCH